MRGRFALIALLICTQTPRVAAQATSETQSKRESGFILEIDKLEIKPDIGKPDGRSKQKTSPSPRIDPSLEIKADKVVYDDVANRVIAQGNVKIHYDRYILNADEVVLDRRANKMTAKGNAKLTAPNGEVVRGERFEATDDFRDAVWGWFARTAEGKTPTTAAGQPPRSE